MVSQKGAIVFFSSHIPAEIDNIPGRHYNPLGNLFNTLMPTVRLNNGNIEADGSLNALSVTTQEVHTDNLNVAGQLTASGNITAERILGDVNVEGLVNAKEVYADAVSTSAIHGLTTVYGDLITEGEDENVLGDSLQSLTDGILRMRHNVWYDSGNMSYVNVLADADSGKIKTCYLVASPASPLVLDGVNWLWDPVDLEDSSRTHVIALQQIGAGPVMANLAYSYPV